MPNTTGIVPFWKNYDRKTVVRFAQLAEELRRSGELQEAVDICQSGLAIHPGYLSARVTLGRALLELLPTPSWHELQYRR